MLPTGLRELLPVVAGILALGLILAAFARQAQPAGAPPAARLPLAARVSWIVALLCGTYLAIDGVFGAGFGDAISMMGVLLVGLALAVRRGEHSAAWILCALWVVAAAILLRAGSPPAAALPLALAGTSAWAGFSLRQYVSSVTTSEQWIRVLPEFAFLRAGWGLLLFARSVVGGGGLAFPRLIEAVIEGGLGLAALKRRTWGAYGLTLGALIDVLMAVHYRFPEEVATRGAVLCVYVLGTYYLRQATMRGRSRRRPVMRALKEKLSGRGR